MRFQCSGVLCYEEKLMCWSLAIVFQVWNSLACRDESNVEITSEVTCLELLYLALCLSMLWHHCWKETISNLGCVLPILLFKLIHRYNEEKGRHVIANRDIKMGDILYVERPYAFVVLPAQYIAHCHNCCGPYVSPIP